MKTLEALFPIALALGGMMLLPQEAGAREPTQIKTCQTINHPGSYELADNLSATGGADCLVITVDFVTIDLAGFSISGSSATGTGILSSGGLQGIAVRNGSISGFQQGVDLTSSNGSIVEGLRVFGGFASSVNGITATGIVRNNTATGWIFMCGIVATGTVTGNYASGNRGGICVGEGSTVIGNTATDNLRVGFDVFCPSNFTDNTAVGNGANLLINGTGCNNTNNVVAP
jgi:parallel beta-helix repeat protein